MSLRMADLLRQTGLIKEEQLVFAMREQQRTGVRIGQVLVDHRMIDETRMYDQLAKVGGWKRLDLGTVMVDPNAASMVEATWAERSGIAPLRIDARTRVFEVATADPTNVSSLDELSFRTGLRVGWVLASETELVRLNRTQFYGAPLDRSPIGQRLPSAEEHVMYGMSEMLDAAQQSVPGEEERRWLAQLQPVFEAQQESARAIQIIFELCVQRGILNRAEYLYRLKNAPD